MTRGRVIGLGIALVILLGLLWLLSSVAEPSYQGRTLAQWLDSSMNLPMSGPARVSDRATKDAVIHMGPRAVRLLAEYTTGRPTSRWRTIARVVAGLPPGVRPTRLILWSNRKTMETEVAGYARSSSAARLLGSLREDARPALPELIGALRQPGSTFGFFSAGDVLSRLGPVALPEVLKALDDPRFPNKLALALVVGRMTRIGPAGTPAVPWLCSGLQQSVPGVSQACAQALGDLALAPETAVPALDLALSNALQNADFPLTRTCAEALGKFGPAARPAVRQLCVALTSPDGITTESAARALGQIGAEPEVALPALITYLQSQGRKHRKYAIEGIAAFGSAASNALPLVRDALGDQDHDTRAAAKEALQKITPNESR